MPQVDQEIFLKEYIHVWELPKGCHALNKDAVILEAEADVMKEVKGKTWPLCSVPIPYVCHNIGCST